LAIGYRLFFRPALPNQPWNFSLHLAKNPRDFTFLTKSHLPILSWLLAYSYPGVIHRSEERLRFFSSAASVNNSAPKFFLASI